MGKRGPPPKPAAIKRLQGNPGKRPIPDEPEYSIGVGQRPEWLNDTEAVRFWNKYAPLLTEHGVVTSGDWASFATLCQTWADWRHAHAALEENGAVTVSGAGSTRPSGYFRVERELAKEFRMLCGRFGLTPSDRSGVPVIEGADGATEEQAAAARLMD